MKYFIGMLIIIIIIVFVISFFIYHRSIMATISEIVLKLIYKIFDIDNKITETEAKIPKYKFKSKVIECDYKGSKIFTLNPNTEENFIIIYLHGGAYINDASYFHYRFTDILCSKLNATIILPHYPLLPESNWKNSFELLEEMYKEITNRTSKKIILMGDSAGGGLALAFTEYLKNKKMTQLSKLVLISPWVDISMTNKDIINFESIDPMLSSEELLEYANLWRGNLNIKDYRVSPLYGDLKNICEVLVFTGDREILYPDILLLNKKLLENKVKTKLIIGKSLNHIYPLYPIKEAKNAIEEIIKFIKEDLK